MALTKKQLKEIEETIRKRFLGLTHEALGERVLTESEIEILKAHGLLKPSVRHMVGESYTLGKVVALMERSGSTAITFAKLKEMIDKKLIPMTGVEERAIQYASEHTGVYIKGIMDDVLKGIKAASARASGEALRAVQNGVAEAIAERTSISELKTTLFGLIDDKNKDWARIAHTEINTAVQNGVYQRIKEESDDGADQLVFKRPAPDACRYCKKLHLQSDGVTPKIFKLSELAESNVGLKAVDWRPVVGSVHPWCFDDQTEVLTEAGWLLFKDVSVERILSVNVDSGLSEWTEIDHHVAYHYRGKMNKYKSKMCDLVVTPTHKTVYKTENIPIWRLEHEDKLPKNYSMLGTIPNWEGCTCSHIVIGDDTYPINLFMEFMGYFLSEGGVCDRNDRNSFQISISQCKEDSKEIMYNCCKELFKDRVWKGETAITISSRDYKLYDFLNLGKSFEKSIPQLIKEQSKDKLKIFVDAFLLGDGHSRPSKWEGKDGNFREERVYYTSSKKLMADLCEVILKLGKRPSVTDPIDKHVKTFKNGDYLVTHPCYTIRENWTTNVRVGDNMFREEIDYDGMVYDVALIKNHTLFVKRNGKVLLSGNCHCQLVPVPTGYDFMKKTVKKDTGEEISDAMLASYEGETRKIAVLSYTGETAAHTGVL